jgi:hypothetical protein
MASTRRGTLAFGHHPLYSNGPLSSSAKLHFAHHLVIRSGIETRNRVSPSFSAP